MGIKENIFFLIFLLLTINSGIKNSLIFWYIIFEISFIEHKKNDIVLLDRYTTSNMGHQASKAKTVEERNKILKFIETLEFDLCELPRPDKVIFLHMPFEASKELRKDRQFSDGNESSEEHLRNAEKTYVDIANMYVWDYINCLKTSKFNNLSDIKTIDEISEEINNIVNQLLDKDSSFIPRMTKF